MRWNALGWVLLALVGGAWIGTTLMRDESPPAPAEPADEEASLRAELAAVHAELARLGEAVDALARAQRGAAGSPASLQGRGPTPGTAGTGPRRTRPTASTPASTGQAEPSRIVRTARNRQASAQSRLWLDQLRSLESHLVREEALRAIRSGIDAEDPVKRLAALRAVRWVGSNDYDHAEYRAAILPHASSEDPDVRRAAREALAVVQPETGDLAWWLEEAQTADRNNAETTTEFLVRVAEGRVEGEVADAVLHLLREGTDIKKAFVMRGLQQSKDFDPRVEARLVEIVRAVEPHDYDSGYFFHFLAPRMDPKSDAVVDLILDRVGQGKGDLGTPLRGLRKGLDERQRAYAADRLVGFAESAGTTYTRQAILDGLRYVAGQEQIARLQVLADDPDADDATRGAARRAIQAAERRR